MDRIASRTDPLGRSESSTYDLTGNPTSSTDRKGHCPVKLINFIFITYLSSILWAAYVYGQTTEVEREVVTVWDQYARCEETMKYGPCFGVLSGAARRGWSQQHRVTNSDEYEQQKLRNDYADLRLTLLRANRSGATVILRVLASGLNEGRSFLTYQEYVLVREQGRWKIDHVQVQGKTVLP